MANTLIDIKQITAPVEPVSLETVKLWAKIDFDADDSLLAIMIPAAREAVERYANIAIGQRLIEVEFYHDGVHPFLLPYQPYVSLTQVQYRRCKLTEWADVTTELDADFELIGNSFKQLQGERGYYIVTYYAGYQSGYTMLPAALQQAICQQVTYMYEHRGTAELSPIAKQSISQYKKITWI